MSRTGPGADIDSFEEWISQLAESKGVSEEQIIHRMMSSYWVLDELTGMVAEQPEGESVPDRSFGDGPEPDDAPREDRTGTGNAGPADTATDRELIDSLTELIEFAAENRGPAETDGRDEPRYRRENDRTADWMRELRDGLERIESRLDERPPDGPEAVEEVTAERIDALESRIDDFESRVEDLGDLEGGVSELREGIERIRTRLDEQAQAVERRTDELSSRLEAVEGETSERMDALESRIDKDFGSVEEILKHLLQSLNDVEERTDTLFRSHSELEPLVTEHGERQRLHEIKSAANRNGARTAECEVCENPVDIGLLSEPECPHCDRPFDDLSSRSWLWKTKHILETGTGNTPSEPLPTEASENAAATGGTQGDSSGDSTRDFDWIGDS